MGEDARRMAGIWRLAGITVDGRINPLRGAAPTGLIAYHESGWMSAQIQPDRAPIAMAGDTPTGDEALAALRGYSAYFGRYSVDEAARTVTHHRVGSVTPGWERQRDFVRAYEFAGDDRLILRPVGNRNELVWERLK